jgi:malate dehydrogenase (oxaloacetate-decarboxylating)
MSDSRVRRAIALLDSRGLVVGPEVSDANQKPFAWPPELVAAHGLAGDGPFDLTATVTALRPTVLIGASGQAGLFDEDTVRTMARAVERPLIFPFSNPTANSEATPADLTAWTEGRALIATGSPFEPVRWGDRLIRSGQGNNVYVFPGIGLGVVTSGARRVTDTMFSVAAETLAGLVGSSDLEAGSLYPPLARLRDISRTIAVAVGRTAIEEGLAEPVAAETLEARVADFMWEPAYPRIKPER